MRGASRPISTPNLFFSLALTTSRCCSPRPPMICWWVSARLEYARQLDAERYKDERTVPLSELNKQDKE